MPAIKRKRSTWRLPRLTRSQLALRPMQVKKPTRKGRFTPLAGVVAHSGSMVVIHVHHGAVTVDWNLAGQSPLTFPARMHRDTARPPTTGAGMLNLESRENRPTSRSPAIRTGKARMNATQAVTVTNFVLSGSRVLCCLRLRGRRFQDLEAVAAAF